MQEILNIVLGFFRALVRFKWTALLCSWVLAIGFWMAIHLIDDRYRASARVFVDTNRILKPLLKGIAVQPDVSQRVALLSRTLLNRPNLEKLARMSDLDTQATTEYEKERLITQLAREIRISGTRGNSTIYTVSYTHQDPNLAKRMVQSILTVFVESAIGDERKDTVVTQEFLDSQIGYYENQLAEADAKLAAFKRENFGMLPDDRTKIEGRLDDHKVALLGTKQQLAVQESKLKLFQQRLGSLPRTLLRRTSTAIASSSSIDEVLNEQKRELSSLQSRYTDKFPRITQLVDSIAELEAQKSLDIPSEQVGSSFSRESNPVYENMLSQYTLAEIEVDALKRQVADNQAAVVKLETVIDAMPDVAKDLNRLVRGNESLLASYNEILSRREAARLSEQVEQNVDDVNFRVIDPPFVSSDATGMPKYYLTGGALVGAFGIAAAVAFLLSQLMPVFYDANNVAGLTGRSVLGSVRKQSPVIKQIINYLDWTVYILGTAFLLFLGAIITAFYMDLIQAVHLDRFLGSNVNSLVQQTISNGSVVGEKLKEVLGR